MQGPTYLETVRVGWMLLWRSVAGFYAIAYLMTIAVVALSPEADRSNPSWWLVLIPIAVALIVTMGWVMPMAIRSMLRKPFRGFRIQFVREPTVATATAPPLHPDDAR